MDNSDPLFKIVSEFISSLTKLSSKSAKAAFHLLAKIGFMK